MSEFFGRLVQLYEDEGFKSLNDFALNGLNYSSSEKLNRLKKPNTNPSFEILTDISNKFDVDMNWLISGREIKAGIQHVAMVSEPGLKYDSQKSLPLIPINAMAGFANSPATVFEMDCERYVVPIFKDADFLIPVRGNSMQPRYNSGDIVACKKLANARDMFFQWGKVYVLDTEQGAMLKRIQPGKDDEHILVVSDNPDPYKPFDLHLSQINAIAIVTGVIRLV